MTLDNIKNTIKIEYEGQSYTVDAAKIEGLDDEQILKGQSYTVDAAKIEGLDDEQILSLLSVGFPGMAGGKIERQEDGSIKIIKRVGTKGSNALVKLLEDYQSDNLPVKIESFNQQPIEDLTLAQWSQVYEGWDQSVIEQMLSQRKRQIRSLIIRLYYCPTKVRPLI